LPAARGGKERAMQEIMTDHQFDGLIKMAIKIIEASKDKEDAVKTLRDLLKESKND
jgi:hypothetical protein